VKVPNAGVRLRVLTQSGTSRHGAAWPAGRGWQDAAMRSFAVKVVVNAVAIWVATVVVTGVTVSGREDSLAGTVLTYLVLGLVFGLVNAVVKPVVKLLAFPLYVVTLGLLTFVVNALMLELTAWLSGHTALTLHLDRFWPTAVLAALVVSFVSLVLNAVVPDRRD
jgi:putative membrane protein